MNHQLYTKIQNLCTGPMSPKKALRHIQDAREDNFSVYQSWGVPKFSSIQKRGETVGLSFVVNGRIFVGRILITKGEHGYIVFYLSGNGEESMETDANVSPAELGFLIHNKIQRK